MAKDMVKNFYDNAANLAKLLSSTRLAQNLIIDGVTRVTVSTLKVSLRRVYDDIKAYERLMNSRIIEDPTSVKRKKKKLTGKKKKIMG
jgi:hypothetical protein